MRVPVICLAVLVTVFLALPEATGVPTKARCISTEEIETAYFKQEDEDTTTYMNRISKELFKIQTSEDFISIVQTMIEKFPTLPLWYDTKYFDLFKTYFTKSYEKTSVETEEDYHRRILTKKPFETDESYVKRLEFLQKLYPHLSIWSDDTYYEKYIKKYYFNVYKKLTDEDDITYYSRLISKWDDESDFAFITRLQLIKKTFPDLPLWYDEKYFDLVKKYYESQYVKKTFETEETYYKRLQVVHRLFPSLFVWSDDKSYESWIKAYVQYVYKRSSYEDVSTYYSRLITKFDDESDEVYINRLSFIQRTFPELPLWYDSNYYDLVKKYYITKYAKKSSETEDEYYKRFIAKDYSESDEIYVKRIQFLQKIYPTLSIWSDKEYYKYIRETYQKVYKQLETEDKETYFYRIVSRWEGESDSIYGRRIHLIHLATISSSIWYDDQYYERYTKSYYSSYYKKGNNEKCADWLKRVLTLLSGECECNAIKRIALIKKCTNYNCWTLEILREIESYFSGTYITTIKEKFFSSVSSYSSSSSSTKKSSSSEESEEENVVIVSSG